MSKIKRPAKLPSLSLKRIGKLYKGLDHPVTIKDLILIILALLLLWALFIKDNQVIAQPTPKTPSLAHIAPLQDTSAQFAPQPPLEVIYRLNLANNFPNGYIYGYCTWYVASKIKIPDGWGNAKYWDEGARANDYTVSSIPKVGTIAQSDAGWAGHVAIIKAIEGDKVLVTEMNVAGWNKVSERWTPTVNWEYIYPKG